MQTRAEAVAVFAALGVDATRPEVDLRREYRRLARDHHPDMPGRDTAQSNKILANLNAAYELLKTREPVEPIPEYEVPRPVGRASPQEAAEAQRAQAHFFRHGPPNPAFGVPLVLGGEHYPEHPTADALFYDPGSPRSGHPRAVALRRSYVVLLVPPDLATNFLRCMQGIGSAEDFARIAPWCQEQGIMRMFHDLRTPLRLGRRAEVPAELRATANVAAMWSLLASKLYGADTDVAVLATREALQNSRDAIDRALKTGQITREAGRFDVRFGTQPDGMTWLEWEDNGIGMSPDIVRTKFLSIGDTTKTGEEAGGFGVAKAIILGCSSTFRWTMHTQDWIYSAEGFDQPVRPTRAPFYKQGVRLRVFDVQNATYKWSEWALNSAQLGDRLRALLAANNLAPRGRHAGVRLFLNDGEVAAAHQGRGTKLLESSTVEDVPQTSVEIRGYRVPSSGHIYARLDGLVQFVESMYGNKSLDIVVDVSTRLPPKDSAYPFNAARMALSGPVARVVNRVEREVAETLRGRSRDLAKIRDYDDADSDKSADARLHEIGEILEQYQRILGGTSIRDALRGAGGGLAHETLHNQYTRLIAERDALRRAQVEARAARANEDRAWFGSTPPHATVSGEAAPPVRVRRTGIESLAPKVRKERLIGPSVNPFGPMVGLLVDTSSFPPARLRKYTANPAKWLPLALVWDSACRLVLAAAGKHEDFTPGFIFEDGVAAAQKKRRVYINPDWFANIALKAYGKQPLQLAVVLHGIACHELTHLLGEPDHDTQFVVAREHLANASAAAVYPITLLLQSVLGVTQADDSSFRELKSILLGVPSGRRATLSSSALVRLRQQLARQVAGLPGALDSQLTG